MSVASASSDRAHHELGWKPERSDLAVIIADAWEFSRTSSLATPRNTH